MPPSDPRNDQQKKTKRYILVSLGLHGGLFLLMLAGNLISPPKADLFLPTVQIDMVALPNQVKTEDATPVDPALPVKDKEPPPAEPPADEDPEALAKPEPEKPKEPEKDVKAEKDAKAALARLREQMKKEQAKNEKKKLKENLNKRQEDLKRFEEAYRSALKGNQTNQGTSSSGALGEATNAYAAHIQDELRRNWGLPAFLQSKGLRASVVMYINPNGTLQRFVMRQSSGNDAFDEYVATALKKSKFLAPPEELASRLRNGGIQVDFPL